MSSSAVRLYAEEYFNSINSIAERIGADVGATVAAYEDLWNTLSTEDQNQVLDDTIIHPEAILKYSHCQPNDLGIECFPRLRLETGYKYVTDDEGGKEQAVKWRDEHSAPFTWMTQSQLNLTVIDDTDKEHMKNTVPSTGPISSPSKKEVCNDDFVDPPDVVLGGSSSRLTSSLSPKSNLLPKTLNSDDSLLTKLKSKTGVFKIQTTLKTAMNKLEPDWVHCKSESTRHSHTQTKVNHNVTNNLKITKAVGNKPQITKPKTPPPPPPLKQKVIADLDPEKKALLPEVPVSKQVFSEPTKEQSCVKSTISTDSIDIGEFHINLDSPSKDVPKTGFDFLDNW